MYLDKFMRFFYSNDNVQILDTSSSNVSTYCGSTIPPSFTSTGGSVQVSLHSDQSGDGLGFKFDFKCTVGGKHFLATKPGT